MMRDLQMECDCKLLEIMRIKMYMLILNNIRKYSEKKRFHENDEQGALTAFPSVLLCGNGRTMLDVT